MVSQGSIRLIGALVVLMLALDIVGETSAARGALHSDFERFAVRSSRGSARVRKRRVLQTTMTNSGGTTRGTVVTGGTSGTGGTTGTGATSGTAGSTGTTGTGGTTNTGGTGGTTQIDGCPSGLSPCGSMCVDLMSNTNACGACGAFCNVTSACCGGVCREVYRSRANCGGCGRICPGTCAAGMCNYGSQARLQ